MLTTDTELPIAEVAQLYLGLEIDRARLAGDQRASWRSAPSVTDWTDGSRRTCLICMLAYLIQQVLEMRLKQAKVPMTAPRAVESFQSIVLNDLEVGNSGVRRQIVTDMGKEHLAVLRGAGLDPKSFQKGWERLE